MHVFQSLLEKYRPMLFLLSGAVVGHVGVLSGNGLCALEQGTQLDQVRL
jgi:hypothetical protein